MHRTKIRILALAGSLRSGGYNRLLLAAAARLSPPGCSVEPFEGLAEVPLFNEELEAGGRIPPAVNALRAAVDEADALLIATPEYNQSIPGVLKNALDWLSRPLPDDVLAGKPVGIMGATTGRWGTRLAQAALRHTLAGTGSFVMPAPQLYIAGAAGLFDTIGELSDPATADALRGYLDAFAGWVDRLHPFSASRAPVVPREARALPAPA